MVRSQWVNLNGLWDYAITPAEAEDFSAEGMILVPFAVESSLSGVGRKVGKDQALWYERSFDLPKKSKGMKTLLHFGAVDWKASIYVNGKLAGEHTGGYASFPMVKYAALRGIPTAVHEANMIPGLTTRMLEKHAGRIMVGFEECRNLYKHPERIVVTGTPVRGDFFNLTHDEAKAALGLGAEEPLVVSFWGSLGASTMNRQMLDFFEKEKADGYPFRHIHAVGSGNWEWMQQELRQRDLTGNARLDVRQYIYDMAVVMRAADLVICRAGASTISEITALAVPTIIVPSPYVANNHQEKNARILAQHGGACLIREEESSGGKLYRTARDILDSPTRRESMSRGMAELGILDATERIYQTVMELVR